MSINNLIGLLLILLPFVGLFGMLAKVVGIKASLLVFTTSIIITFMIILGIYLLIQ